MNEYDYNNFNQQDDVFVDNQEPLFQRTDANVDEVRHGAFVDFTKPEIAALPRVLMMGPRRGGKTSIQVTKSCMSPYSLSHQFLP